MAMTATYFDQPLNIDRICRICLLEGANLSPIFCSEQEVDEFSGLQQKIQLCGSIEIHENDGFPSLICDVCIYKASIAHEFRQQCQQSDARLRLLYEKPSEANIADSCTQTEPQTRIIFTRKMPSQPDGYYVKNELQQASPGAQEYATAIEAYADTNVSAVTNRDENPIDCQDEKLFLCNIASFEETKGIMNKEGTILAVEPSHRVDCPIVRTEITTTLMTVNADGELETQRLIVKENDNKCNGTAAGIEEEYLSQEMLNESVMEGGIEVDSENFEEQQQDQLLKQEQAESMKKREIEMESSSYSGDRINEDGYFAIITNENEKNCVKPTHKCDSCAKRYVTERGLKNHMKIHEKNHRCAICRLGFSKLKSMESHMKIHEKKKAHVCQTCYASFAELSSLKRHSKKHESKNADNEGSRDANDCTEDPDNLLSDEKRDSDTEDDASRMNDEIDDFDEISDIYKCRVCEEYCSSLEQLERHNIVHAEKKYSCTVCEEGFPLPVMLKEHAETYGHGLLDNLGDDNKLFESDNENFGDSAIVEDETRNDTVVKDGEGNDEDGVGEFKCQHCNKVMATKKGLRRHVSMHKPKAGPVTCDVCKKVCASQARLSLHLKTHNKPKEKVQREYLCHICSKVYPSNSSLTYHMRTHSGVKPHVCKICNSGFTTTTSLANHIRIHTGDKPFVCNVCGAAFAVSSAFRRHLTRHTGEANYLCKTCGKAFKRLSTLKEHTYTHSGEKPYVCKTCGAAYSHSGSLFAHQKRCRAQYSEMIEEHNVAHHIHVNNVQTAVRSLAVIGQMY